MDEVIDASPDERSLFDATCRVIVSIGGYVMAWVGLAEDDVRRSVRPAAHAGFEAAYLAGIDVVWSDTERGRGPAGTAIRTRKPAIVQRLSADASFSPFREDALLRGYQACISLPLSQGARAYGALSVYAAEPDAFAPREASLLHEIAKSIARAMVAIRARDELQRLNADLERRVAERTAELVDLYDNAPCGYHSIGPDGRILRMNATELRWLGLTRAEVDGRPYRELIPDEGRAAFDRAIARLGPDAGAPSGPPLEIEYEVCCKDGSRRSLVAHVATLRPLEGHHGERRPAEPLRHRFAVLDLSERKRAERALAEQTTHVRDLLAGTSEIVFSTDLRGRFLFVNEACCEALGHSLEELRESTIEDIVHPSYRPASSVTFRSILRGEAPSRRFVERLLVTRSGATIHVEGYLSAYASNGVIAGMRAFLRDVTRERQAEDAIRKSRDQLSAANAALERASRAKDEFLASMSHELRTPLNAVLGLSEALREGVYGPIGDRGQKALLRVDASGRHLLSLINDILDLSKLEAGQSQLEMSQVSVEEVCRASLQMVQEAADKKAQNVSVDIRGAHRPIEADERRLVQILVNLLSNSVKFTPQGGALGLIVTPEESGVRFTVWDDGIGIAQEDLPKLFQPFVQVDASLSRRHAGTGLGLALVRKLVELHGGGVEVTSVLGEGSRFSIILPATARAREKARTLESAPKRRYSPLHGMRAVPDPRRGLGRVVLAEDDEVNVVTVGDFLRSRGYEVLVARNGKEAVAMAREESPDLILMDIQMPDMDGVAAMQQIRSDPSPRVREVPIVALTALAMVGDRERCIAAGADDYLTKPVRLTDILLIVESRRARSSRT